MRDVMTTIVDRLEEEFTLEPREVFTDQGREKKAPSRPVRLVKPEPEKRSFRKPGTWFRSRKA